MKVNPGAPVYVAGSGMDHPLNSRHPLARERKGDRPSADVEGQPHRHRQSLEGRHDLEMKTGVSGGADASREQQGQARDRPSSLQKSPADGADDDMFAIVLTPAQWRKLMILAFGSLVNNITYSLLVPFFPTIAKERGVAEYHVGLIFGMFALSAFATAPFAGVALQKKRCTRLHMMIFGMLLNAIFTALFGCLEFYNADKHGGVFWYLVLAYGSRIVAGVGCGLTDTSLYALIAATFQGHKQLPALMGTMEFVCGLGFVGGPALGGWLYDSTSFSTTMILPSAVLAVYVVLPWYYLQDPLHPQGGGGGEGGGGGSVDKDGEMKDDEDDKKTDVKMEHLFRTFRFVSVCWSGVLANVQFGYLEATYADQAQNPGSATRVGLLFSIMAFVYCILTSPVGMICNRLGLHNCLAIGFVMESVGYVMLVPPASWGEGFAGLTGREHVAMIVNGLGAAFSYVPIYPALLKASGRENVEGVADLVAGVTGSSFQLGNFLGPVAAGMAVSMTSTYHAAIVFICAVFCVQAVVEARGILFGVTW